ncbi:hypothetical protein KVR01_000389 [Diaporthe batatas]|uniref:uncharacterized protein n=1 Tax=Diaporthe batatas TaxID=748121 RepID=UPI001D050136|nr:uncharacterized protein KVR01_000389 [Diaporthe batatas]KAG8169644.1 hypothetical protein KVR01_000389 [Diaporthe batatas]
MRSASALAVGLCASLGDAWPLSFNGILKKRASSFTPLRFNSDGTFQISVFNDLHYGEAQGTVSGWWADFLSDTVMNLIFFYENPQLVVLNGDLLTGENAESVDTATDKFEQIAGRIQAANLPWASTYGNHDSEYYLSRDNLFSKEKTYTNSLTQNMLAESASTTDVGVTNYYLEVFSSDESDKTPKLILWFFDSRGGNYFQREDSSGLPVGQPNWVDPAVASWLSTAAANITSTYGATIPSLAFVHIPVQAFLKFQNAGVNANQEPGINDDNPLSPQDVAFMQALLQLEGLEAVFSGHDHGDDWCFKWDSQFSGMSLAGNGLNLCFGRKSGHGGYGSWTPASRQVKVSLGGNGAIQPVETWMRQEGSTVSGRVTLNSTFGTDSYPAVASTDSWVR